MNNQDYYRTALDHRIEHKCGGVPYEYGDLLTEIVSKNHSSQILELGTGIGYSTYCLALGNKEAHIDTIEQHQLHIDLAQQLWKEYGCDYQITTFVDKAEAVLPEMKGQYDLIFFDGYDPSLKFLVYFEKLLKKGGMLLTANLFLKHPEGGRYMRHMKREKKWNTEIFEDTSISTKLF